MKANFYGLKTLYYSNVRDGSDDEVTDEKKEKLVEIVNDQVVPVVEVEEECGSCSI